MFTYFLKREITDRYLGNVMGLAWVFIQPLITLVIYSFVFENIFKARIPEAAHLGFAVYLAIGFWPWTAFSESLLRSITSWWLWPCGASRCISRCCLLSFRR